MALSPRSKKYMLIVLVCLIGGFLFYWYSLRPIVLARECATSASADARKLLASKVEITRDSTQKRTYASLLERNMYLRKDYLSFLSKCLLQHGIVKKEMFEDNSGDETPAGGETQNAGE